MVLPTSFDVVASIAALAVTCTESIPVTTQQTQQVTTYECVPRTYTEMVSSCRAVRVPVATTGGCGATSDCGGCGELVC